MYSLQENALSLLMEDRWDVKEFFERPTGKTVTCQAANLIGK
jgi:hypothetical protein